LSRKEDERASREGEENEKKMRGTVVLHGGRLIER
jgi:hypothetical protein